MNVTELFIASWFVKGSIAVAGYLILIASSGPVVSAALRRIGTQSEHGGVHGESEREATDSSRGGNEHENRSESKPDDERVSKLERDIGQVVGKCENVLVLSFVLANAYTALAVVFAAKSIVRREDMVKNSKYYLAGTLVNFTYSILFALVVKRIVSVS